MRLPETLYCAVKHCMSGHAAWHVARLNPLPLTERERREVERARKFFPDAICLTNEGAGAQFLEFHRDMVREFKWLLLHTPEHSFSVAEWDGIPERFSQHFKPGYIEGVMAALPPYIAGASLEALGAFVERTERGVVKFSDIHNKCHAAIAQEEALRDPKGTRPDDADMLHWAEAPNNEHFWSLHYWIDGLYSAWQAANGLPVDVSPKRPPDHHHAEFKISDALARRARQTFFRLDLE